MSAADTDLEHGGEIPWDLPQPYAIPVGVEAGDVDRLGHVNNAVYLAWCERVAWSHANAVGVDWPQWKALDRAMAVMHARLAYAAPALSGDALVVGNWIVRNDGKLRASRRFQVVRPSDGRTLLRAELDYVCIEISTGRPRRFPPAFRDAYPVLPEVQTALDRGVAAVSDA